MKFHIPKQQKPADERVDVKLDVSVLKELDLYCQYMESERDYVIGAVLRIVFKKDKGFAAWKRRKISRRLCGFTRGACAPGSRQGWPCGFCPWIR